MISRAIGIFLMASLTLFVGGGYLHANEGDNFIWWMLDEPMIEEVNGGTPIFIGDLVGRGGEAKGLGVNAVRVSMNNNGMLEYLNLDTDDGWQSWIELPGIENRGGAWTEVWSAGPTLANISGYSLSRTDPDLVFMIEIGNYTEDGNWIILATSKSSTLGELHSNGFVFDSALEVQGHVEWTGGSYSVPEPNSGILLLIGTGLLILKRKTRKA